VQDGEILECPAAGQIPLDHRRGTAHRGDAFRSNLPDDARRQRRARERHALEHLGRQAERLTHLADAVLAQLHEGLKDGVAKGCLRVDAQLREDVVLPLDPRYRLIDIGEDRALEEHAGATLAHQAAEHVPVERLGDGLALGFRIRDALERRKERLLGVHDLDRHAKVGEDARRTVEFASAHQAIVDQDGSQPRTDGAVPQQRDDGRIHAAGQGIDGRALPDGGADRRDLLRDEALRVEFAGRDLLGHGGLLVLMAGPRGTHWRLTARRPAIGGHSGTP